MPTNKLEKLGKKREKREGKSSKRHLATKETQGIRGIFVTNILGRNQQDIDARW